MVKILVIDDDKKVLDTIKMRLEREEMDVLTAGSGELGLELASKEHPELIVLDLAMPGLDGFDVMRRLQLDDVTWEIPVVVMSAEADQDGRTRSLELGARRFLRKPFSPRYLLHEVKRVLSMA